MYILVGTENMKRITKRRTYRVRAHATHGNSYESYLITWGDSSWFDFGMIAPGPVPPWIALSRHVG